MLACLRESATRLLFHQRWNMRQAPSHVSGVMVGTWLKHARYVFCWTEWVFYQYFHKTSVMEEKWHRNFNLKNITSSTVQFKRTMYRTVKIFWMQSLVLEEINHENLCFSKCWCDLQWVRNQESRTGVKHPL